MQSRGHTATAKACHWIIYNLRINETTNWPELEHFCGDANDR